MYRILRSKKLLSLRQTGHDAVGCKDREDYIQATVHCGRKAKGKSLLILEARSWEYMISGRTRDFLIEQVDLGSVLDVMPHEQFPRLKAPII